MVNKGLDAVSFRRFLNKIPKWPGMGGVESVRETHPMGKFIPGNHLIEQSNILENWVP